MVQRLERMHAPSPSIERASKLKAMQSSSPARKAELRRVYPVLLGVERQALGDVAPKRDVAIVALLVAVVPMRHRVEDGGRRRASGGRGRAPALLRRYRR